MSQFTTDQPAPRLDGDIPFNLETLRRHLGQVILARRVLSEDLVLRQRLLEQSVYNVAVERFRHQAELFDQLGLPNKSLHSTDLRTWMWHWHVKLQARIEAELANLEIEERVIGMFISVMPATCAQCSYTSIARLRRKGSKEDPQLSPFLKLLKPEKLSLITVLELMHLHGSGGVQDGMKTARALLAVGRAVEGEHKAEMCKKNNISVPNANPARSGDQNVFTNLGYRDLHARRVTARKYMEDSEEWTSDWSQLVRVKIGSFLVDCLMDVATVQRSIKDPRTGEKL